MADAPRLLEHATAAFVDRATIDWPALLSRVHTSPDRALFENLYALAAVRNAARKATLGAVTPSRASFVAWTVVTLASIETASLLALLAAAFASGESIGNRTPQLILALAFAAASVPLGAATFRDRRSLFLLATFTSLASIFTRSTIGGLPAAWSAPVNQLLEGIWIEAFLPACVWQFALDFPQVPRFTSFDRLARRAVAASWVLGGLLFGVNLVATGVAAGAGPLQYFLRDHSSQLFWRLLSFSLAPALIAILVRSQRAPASERRKVSRLAFVIAGGIAPFLILTIVRTALPPVDAWFRPASSAGSRWLYYLIAAALAATPVLSTAAVLVDRPFELQAVLRHTPPYVLAKRALTAAAIASVLALVVVFYGLERSTIVGAIGDVQARLLLSRSVAAGLLLMVCLRLLTALSRSVSGRAVDRDRQVALALERLARARGARETLAVLSRELRDGVGAETRVLVANRNGLFVDVLHDAVPLGPDAGLLALLREHREPLDLSPGSPLLRLLPREDREWIEVNGAHVVASWRRRDGEIGAVVTFGPKAHGVPFDRRDSWLIVTLLASATPAFDREPLGACAASEPAGARIRRARALDEVAFECSACGRVGPSRPLPCDCGGDPALAALPYCVARKFLVERRLGSGGMGIVYLARDTALDREVALKTLPGLRRDAVRSLRDEARAMAALNHESLATLYGLEMWHGTPMLVVEYFPRGTLARRLAERLLPPPDAVALGIRIARALVYMHAMGVLHRDLKPSNIAFSATGAAKLLDFGLATLVSSSTGVDDEPFGRVGTIRERFVGTPAYVPPETYRGAPLSPAVDLWALSVIIVEAVSGVNPFSATHRGPRSRPAAILPDVCSQSLRSVPSLRAFVERALAREPALRFQTSPEFHAALEAVADALAVRITG